jgi:ribokinase
MAGADVSFITRLGEDAFAEMAMKTWEKAGVKPAVTRDRSSYTGAAYIFIEDKTGNNAIIVCPGAASTISPADIDARAELISGSAVFVTQLEQPIPAAKRALEIARKAGVTTVLNPAPAAPLGDDIFALCDYVTPNETEAEALTGKSVGTVDEARKAGDALIAMGVGTAIITLGERGALIHNSDLSELVPAFKAGKVVDTTGAGDAFNGGFAAALARGFSPLEAVRFGCAVASISVTRPGTAPSMPAYDEAMALYRSS